MEGILGVVFDLDDTLYPERQYVLSGFRAVANWAKERIGLPASESYDILVRNFDSGTRGNSFDLWLAKSTVNEPELRMEAVSVYRRHKPSNIGLFSDVLPCLNRLRQKHKLGLLTDGYCETQQNKINALAIEPYFAAVVLSDRFGREHWKPSPKPFRAVCDLLGLDPETCVYVADNPRKDFIGARSIGMYSLRVRRSDGEYSHLEPESDLHAPHGTISSLKELDVSIQSLSEWPK